MTSPKNKHNTTKTKDTLEDFFSGTLFLYRSDGGTCGCAVPRDTALSSLLTCPLCGAADKIVTVLDGYTHSLRTITQKNDKEQPPPPQERPTLRCKHGSLTYQVGLPAQQPSSSPRSFSVFGWFLGDTKDAVYYAQNHLAYMLGLELSEMKVRSVGFDLYEQSYLSEKQSRLTRIVHVDSLQRQNPLSFFHDTSPGNF